MKKNTYSLLFILLLIISWSCDDKKDSPKPNTDAEILGTFVGTIQVSNDPQTQLGYIYNAKVTVNKSGNNSTIKIKGDLSVDREYTGNIGYSANGIYNITITKQIKPTEKNAIENLVIQNNQLTFLVGIANDSEKVKSSPTDTDSFTISGNLRLIGVALIRE